MKFAFKGLLQNDGWTEKVSVTTDDKGIITSIETDPNIRSDDLAIPGFQNAHSHSFQYAMAGLAENHYNDSDFWTWREAMYRLALTLNPDQFEAIAKFLFAEMLRHGYSRVAEFHYLHHSLNGSPYDDIAEMGKRLISAAKAVGIGITLIPIFYQKGGFGKTAEQNQKRFVSKTIDAYQKLFEASNQACEDYVDANIAIGIHSMRAVEPKLIKEISDSFPKTIPFHIHISEQLKEVEDSLEYLGMRPVKWMLENIELSDRFHFVHATHLTNTEIQGLAEKNVNVVLCPTTEGNLGDGVFPLREFQASGGNWSIGTDSHVSLNPFEELRLLDYGQRLVSHKRNTFTGQENGNSGSYAIAKTTLAGRKAMNNFQKGYFSVGQPLDACVISAKHPLIESTSPINYLNTFIYSSDETMQKGTIIRGKWKSDNGHCLNQEKISEDFVKVMKEIKNR
jgi:formimidoylglutamate deiminase